jgi:TRAP-type mannitol/chloroaromatic compound transport system permease small subunit
VQGGNLEKFITFIDQITTWVGKAFGWCLMIMTFGMAYEVFVRYLLRNPTPWAFDFSYMMYGTLFMMAGAYTLSRDGHVRGDVIYRLWSPKTQAIVELILYIVFFFPGILALILAGWEYAGESWFYKEVSVFSPANVPIFQFKMIMPIAAMLCFIQGIAQVCRCIICMRTGQWPAHLEDVEEMEAMLQHQQEDDAAQREGGLQQRGGEHQ